MWLYDTSTAEQLAWCRRSRRWLDVNGARTWLWAAAALALLWLAAVLNVPM